MSLSTHQRIRRAMAEKKKNACDEETFIPDLDLEKLRVTDLKALAKDNGINLKGVSDKPNIIKRIMEAKNQADTNAALDDKPDAEDKSHNEDDESDKDPKTPPHDSEVTEDEADSGKAQTGLF